jgi:hypothetical protein
MRSIGNDMRDGVTLGKRSVAPRAREMLSQSWCRFLEIRDGIGKQMCALVVKLIRPSATFVGKPPRMSGFSCDFNRLSARRGLLKSKMFLIHENLPVL